MKLKFLFIFFMSALLYEGEVFAKSQNILILIGYADELRDESGSMMFFSHVHHTQIAQETQTSIHRQLLGLGFSQSGSEYTLESDRVVVLNANVLCPGESSIAAQQIRRSICKEQKERSEQISEYLNFYLNSFDVFFYIGHARQGLGLGLGPFTSEYMFPFKFFNSVELGKLKKVVLASCDSFKYYDSEIFKESGVAFIGSEGKKLWTQDQLPLVIRELNEMYFERRMNQLLR